MDIFKVKGITQCIIWFLCDEGDYIYYKMFLFDRNNEVKFREDLMNIVRIIFSFKIFIQYKDYFFKLVVDVVFRLKVRQGLNC